MSEQISRVKAKLDRSKAHLDDLENSIGKYFESTPFIIEKTEEEAKGDLVYLVRIIRSVPLEIASIAGDVVHNLRSALDHLIWQAVEFSGGSPTRSTCFPIHKDSVRIDEAIAEALKGANKSAISLVRHLRPCRGSNDILWKLHSLDIVDKHRLLFGVGSAYKSFVIQMKLDVPWQDEAVISPPLALNPADRLFPLNDGDELFRVKSQAKSAGLGLLEPRFNFEIAFGDGDAVLGEPMVPTLRSIQQYIERVVDLFEKYVFK